MCSTSVDPRPSDDLKTGQGFPPLEDFRRQHLGGRHRHSQRRKIRRRRTFSLGQGRVERRQAEERQWAIALDRLENRRGLGWPGSSRVAAPAENGKVIGIAEAVGEEHFRHREADVAGRRASKHFARTTRPRYRPCRAADGRCPWVFRSSPTNTSRTPFRCDGCRLPPDRPEGPRATSSRRSHSRGMTVGRCH